MFTDEAYKIYYQLLSCCAEKLELQAVEGDAIVYNAEIWQGFIMRLDYTYSIGDVWL